MKNKAPGIDNLTSEAMILGGDESVKQITPTTKNQILETKKKIPVEWTESKTIILHKKEIRKTQKITGLSVYFPTCTNCSHGYYKNEWKRF